MTDAGENVQGKQGKGRGRNAFLTFIKRRFLTRFVFMMVIPAFGLLFIWMFDFDRKSVL